MLVGGYTSALVTTHLWPAVSPGRSRRRAEHPGWWACCSACLRCVSGLLSGDGDAGRPIHHPLGQPPPLPRFAGRHVGPHHRPVPVIFGISFGEVNNYFYLSLITLILTTILMLNISRSRLEPRASSPCATTTWPPNCWASICSATAACIFHRLFLAGVAGALKAHSQRGVGTEFGYGLEESIIMLGMLVIGGWAPTWGHFGCHGRHPAGRSGHCHRPAHGPAFPVAGGSFPDIVPADFLRPDPDAVPDFRTARPGPPLADDQVGLAGCGRFAAAAHRPAGQIRNEGGESIERVSRHRSMAYRILARRKPGENEMKKILIVSLLLIMALGWRLPALAPGRSTGPHAAGGGRATRADRSGRGGGSCPPYRPRPPISRQPSTRAVESGATTLEAAATSIADTP